MDQLLRLQGKSFEWKRDKDKNTNYGFIAQEVEEIFPEWVTSEKDDESLKWLSQDHIPALTVEALRELKQDFDAIKAEFNKIKGAAS